MQICTARTFDPETPVTEITAVVTENGAEVLFYATPPQTGIRVITDEKAPGKDKWFRGLRAAEKGSGVSRSTISRWIDVGEVEHERHGDSFLINPISLADRAATTF